MRNDYGVVISAQLSHIREVCIFEWSFIHSLLTLSYSARCAIMEGQVVTGFKERHANSVKNTKSLVSR